MGAKKYPRRLRAYTKVAANGTGIVRSDLIQRGQVLACQSIGFRNRTGARGNLELYIEETGTLTFIADQTTPLANRWYWYPYAQHIKEGERIEAQQASCLADDELDLHVIGYVTFGVEEVTT
uniref:Uncharacterized protein n=1 Tax=viral metagenome TaxID=1070528 RepID=A0A6M3XZY3_9ZZZZ